MLQPSDHHTSHTDFPEKDISRSQGNPDVIHFSDGDWWHAVTSDAESEQLLL